MKNKVMLVAMVFVFVFVLCLCLFTSCEEKDEEDRYKNITIIPTVVDSDPNGIWASDILIRPEDITENHKVLRIRKGTKIGEWVAPVDGLYSYEQIKKYLEVKVNDINSN